MVTPTAITVLHNLVKAQSVDKELKAKLLHMTDFDTNDMESFHSIKKLDGGQEENEVLDELFNVKLNFAMLSLAYFFQIRNVHLHEK